MNEVFVIASWPSGVQAAVAIGLSFACLLLSSWVYRKERPSCLDCGHLDSHHSRHTHFYRLVCYESADCTCDRALIPSSEPPRS